MTHQLIENAYNEHRDFLMEHESKDLIAEYKIPVGNYKLTHSPQEAVEYALEIGFPVVAKVMSPDIIHKTEAGVIQLNLNSEKEVKNAYNEIIENAHNYNSNATIVGVNIQEMARDGIVEVIIGGLRDVNFGSVLMFGLGGIFVEIFEDVVYRVCPIDNKEVFRMIQGIKAYPLLNGYRGREKGDVSQIAECIVNCCELLTKNPEIKELDLNPVIVFEKGKGIMVVDARILLKEED